MRTSWWACTFMGVLTCSVTYQLFSQPLLLDRSSDVSDKSERPPLDQKSERPLDLSKMRRGCRTFTRPLLDLEPDQLPIAKDQARPEDAADTAACRVLRPER